MVLAVRKDDYCYLCNLLSHWSVWQCTYMTHQVRVNNMKVTRKKIVDGIGMLFLKSTKR